MKEYNDQYPIIEMVLLAEKLLHYIWKQKRFTMNSFVMSQKFETNTDLMTYTCDVIFKKWTLARITAFWNEISEVYTHGLTVYTLVTEERFAEMNKISRCCHFEFN